MKILNTKLIFKNTKAIVYVLLKTPSDKKFTILHVLLVLIAAGSIGNMIDRISQDYVVDFIYFV